jgi:hypothetical protein
VQTVTSSIVYSSGSNIFGNSLSNIQSFSGSSLFTGCVGIGTSSPVGILNLSVTSGATNMNIDNIATQYGNIVFRESGANKVYIQYVSPTFATANRQNALEFGTNTTSSFIAFRPADIEAMRITSTGQIGMFGQAPRTCNTVKALESTNFIIEDNGAFGIKNNVYYNGTNNLYITSTTAERIYASAGFHYYDAPSGTAGNAATFTERFTIANGGYIGVGATSPAYNLHVCCSNNVAYIAVETGASTCAAEATVLQKSPDGLALIALGATAARGIGDAARCDWSFGLRTGGCLRFSGQVAANNTHFLLAPNGVACFASTVCAVGLNLNGASDAVIDMVAPGATAYIKFKNACNSTWGIGASFIGRTCNLDIYNFATSTNALTIDKTGITSFTSNVCSAGVFVSNVGATTSTYGFTQCGAGVWTRMGVPNNSYAYWETNASAGFYIDGALSVPGLINGQNAACFKSNSGARALYIRQTNANSDNIIQFVDNGGSNIWEVVGRNNVFYIYNAAQGALAMCLVPANNNVHFPGSISKGSGTFNIEHPLESKKCTHRLIHSFIEGPQADLIYRGKINLNSGIACINIDCIARMTEGTFQALNRCTQVFTTNESSWSAIKGKLQGNILVIESQNTESNDEISWMVIGERQDKHIKDTSITDSLGRIITETIVDEPFTCTQ